MQDSHPYAERIEHAIEVAKQFCQTPELRNVTAFDIRGQLYDLAHRLAPDARQPEIDSIRNWLLPIQGERSIEIAAGSGFLTKYLWNWTGAEIVAIDPSREQLDILRQRVPGAQIMCCSPDEPGLPSKVMGSEFDFATSLGGIHHVSDHRRLFENVSQLLRPGGRFIFGDVCAQTSLARHFDEIVSRKCLTGHNAHWLSVEALPDIVGGLPLKIVRISVLPLHMKFRSELEIALFFKGLHAYDMEYADILRDLRDVLGIVVERGTFKVNWPLLFAHLEKE